MIRLLGLITLLLFSGFSHAELSKERVFILAGQSNMMGRGRTDQLPEELKEQPDNVSYYTHGRKSNIAKYSMFGPEVEFTHAIAKTFPNDKIIIIKSAASGSAIDEWLPGSPLYEGLLRQVKFVVDPAKTNIEAVVWMQGETDARSQESAEKYKEKLTSFITTLRHDLHAEQAVFLVGRISQKDINFPMEKQIRNAQDQVCQDDPNSILVDTDGLGKIYDKVHYNAKGQVELGRRFAIGFINKRKERLMEQINLKRAAN